IAFHQVGNPAASGHGFKSYAGKHQVRTSRQSQIQNPQQTALENQRVNAGELRLKEALSGADDGEYRADGEPGLASPREQIDGSKDHADGKKDQAFGAFAACRAAAQAFGLHLGKATRQQHANASGQSRYDHYKPDVVSTQKSLSPFQTGCAARACS